MIKSKKLSKQKKISHGFFNRNGGKSGGIYKSLNCGPGSNDKIKNIKENLKIVKKRSLKNQGIFIYSIKFTVINLFFLIRILNLIIKRLKQMQ